jgi:hypothetical protein
MQVVRKRAACFDAIVERQADHGTSQPPIRPFMTSFEQQSALQAGMDES